MSFKQYKQGIYNPENKEKYIGSTPIVYRSGLELKFMRWCDRNSKVVNWGAESVIIPYKSPKDGRMHKYYVDNFVALKTDKGIIKYLVEIKPSAFTKPPTNHGNKKASTLLYEKITWAVNTEKWKSAKKWAKFKGCEFTILTEKEINNL